MNNDKVIYVDSWQPSREEENYLISDNKLVINNLRKMRSA